jgi:hypothetical protein
MQQQMRMYSKDAMVDWQAHYSPKYGHCYIRIDAVYVTVLDSRPRLSAATTTQLGPDKWMQSNDSMILRDALEHGPVANVSHFGEDSPATGAHVRDRSTTDEEATAFIKDHMEN